MTRSNTDRIEKTIILRAPRSRVWRAITDVSEFNHWFRVALAGRFAPGSVLSGPVTQQGYEDLSLEITVERMEPEHLFSWRWHPGGCEGAVSQANDPTTLVVFELEDVPEGTRLKIVESGFDRIPLERRALAYRGNESGWTEQTRSLEQYVLRQAA
jgi:uncharacterized protein YndB with AHSA1/START domain